MHLDNILIAFNLNTNKKIIVSLVLFNKKFDYAIITLNVVNYHKERTNAL
jgi:hypothetical protein